MAAFSAPPVSPHSRHCCGEQASPTASIIALLAWVLSPPVVVVWMATLGLIGYVKAYRAGLARSRCYLRDVRLVLAYLSIAWLAGAYFTVKEIISLLG